MTKSLTEALVDGLTAGALAHSEQVTGIPFFQMQQARKEKESVRSEQKQSNSIRLDAAIKTGLIAEEDVVVGGGRAAILADPNFSKIYDGLVTVRDRSLAESRSAENDRKRAEIAYHKAGLGSAPAGMETQDLLLSAADADAAQVTMARREDRAADTATALLKSLDTLASSDAPDLAALDALTEQVSALVSSSEDIPGIKGQTALLGTMLQSARATVNQKVRINESLAKLNAGDATGIAELNPPDQLKAFESPDVIRYGVRVEAGLNTVKKLQGLSPEVLELLGKDPANAKLLNLLEEVNSSKNAAGADILMAHAPELGARLAELKTENLDSRIARAKAETTTLPTAIAQDVARYETAANLMPEGSVEQAILRGASLSSDKRFEIAEAKDGEFVLIETGDPAALSPMDSFERLLRNENMSDADRLRLATNLSGAAIGGIPMDPGVQELAIKTRDELAIRMSDSELQDLFDRSREDNSETLFKRVAKFAESGSVVDFQQFRDSGEAYSVSRQSITGLPASRDLAAALAKAKDEERNTVGPAQTAAQRRVKNLMDQQTLAIQGEDAMSLATGALTVLHAGDAAFVATMGKGAPDGNRIVDYIKGWRGEGKVAIGGTGQPLPGEPLFLEDMEKAETPAEREQALEIFLTRVLKDSVEDSTTLVESYFELYDQLQAQVDDNLRITKTRRGGPFTKSKDVFTPTLDDISAYLEATPNIGGTTVRLSEKQRADQEFAVPMTALSILSKP